MNKRIGVLMTMAAGIMASNQADWLEIEKEKEAERQRQKRISEIERNKKRGLKEFKYGDNVVFARNKKNADRKAKNKGYII